jgi:hypothetical protein
MRGCNCQKTYLESREGREKWRKAFVVISQSPEFCAMIRRDIHIRMGTEIEDSRKLERMVQWRRPFITLRWSEKPKKYSGYNVLEMACKIATPLNVRRNDR